MASLNIQKNSYSGWNDCPAFVERTPSYSSVRSKKRISSGSSVVYNALNGPLPPSYAPGSNNTSPQNSPVTSYCPTYQKNVSVSPPLRAVSPEYFYLNNNGSTKQEVVPDTTEITTPYTDDVNECKANVQKLLSLPTTLSVKEFQYHCNKLTSDSVSSSLENRIFLNEIATTILNDVQQFDRELLLDKVVEFMMKNSNISWCTSLKRIISTIQV